MKHSFECVCLWRVFLFCFSTLPVILLRFGQTMALCHKQPLLFLIVYQFEIFIGHSLTLSHICPQGNKSLMIPFFSPVHCTVILLLAPVATVILVNDHTPFVPTSLTRSLRIRLMDVDDSNENSSLLGLFCIHYVRSHFLKINIIIALLYFLEKCSICEDDGFFHSRLYLLVSSTGWGVKAMLSNSFYIMGRTQATLILSETTTTLAPAVP